MKRLGIIIAIICFLSTPVLGDLYQWTDERGVVHVTDDLLLVPPKYRDEVKVYKEAPTPSEVPLPVSPPAPPAGEELYGGQTLEWWREEFEGRKAKISELERTITVQKRYVEVFERGRRFGQTYSPEEVKTYEEYKRGLPSLQEGLDLLKEDLEELRRKATIYGVPREVRE